MFGLPSKPSHCLKSSTGIPLCSIIGVLFVAALKLQPCSRLMDTKNMRATEPEVSIYSLDLDRKHLHSLGRESYKQIWNCNMTTFRFLLILIFNLYVCSTCIISKADNFCKFPQTPSQIFVIRHYFQILYKIRFSFICHTFF